VLCTTSFAVAIVLIGLLSIAFRLEKAASRYASITLAIIILIPRAGVPWTIALHRFLEVSVAISVALAMWRCGQKIDDCQSVALPNSTSSDIASGLAKEIISFYEDGSAA
jgi:hypothetical protein